MIIHRHGLLLLFVVVASSISAGNISPEYLSLLNVAYVRPLELAEDKTSVTTLIQDFGDICDLPLKDTDALTSAVTQTDLVAVRTWATSGTQNVLWDRSSIARRVVLNSMFPNKRTSASLIVDANFASFLRALLQSITNFTDSPAGKLKATLPQPLLQTCARALNGETLASDELNELKQWTRDKIADPKNLHKVGVAVNLCLTVILDRAVDLGEFKQSVGNVPRIYLLQVLAHTQRSDAVDMFNDIVEDGIQNQNLDMDYLIFMLSQWEMKTNSCLIANSILRENKCLSSTQKVRLLSIVVPCKIPNSIMKYQREATLLQEVLKGKR